VRRVPIDVLDGELDSGVLAVEAVRLGGGAGEVGQKGVILNTVGEKGLLGGFSKPGAAHGEPPAVVVDM